MKPIISKWAFRVSWNPDGTVKYRCRIVAKEFKQQPGADFDLTFAPTLQLKTALVMSGIVAAEDWEAEVTDVGSAYLESKIDKELYMLLPKDLWVEGEPRVFRLSKVIYELKQAGELWSRPLASYLRDIGFSRCTSDTCLYRKTTSDGGSVYIMVYVDDLIIVARSRELIDEVKASLEKRFSMKHQGCNRTVSGNADL
jgi:hypothetical protein